MIDLTPLDRAPAARDTELSAAAWDLIDEATPAAALLKYEIHTIERPVVSDNSEASGG